MRISNARIKEIVQEVCDKVGYAELVNTPIRFSNHLRTTMGVAHITGYGPSFSASIKLSNYIWNNSTEEAQKENLIHEFCHVIDRYEQRVLNINNYDTRQHGRNWSRLMRLCGLVPKRCHNNPVLRNKRHDRYPVRCDCMTHMITGKKLANIATGRRNYRCTKCRAMLIPQETLLSRYR